MVIEKKEVECDEVRWVASFFLLCFT